MGRKTIPSKNRTSVRASSGSRGSRSSGVSESENASGSLHPETTDSVRFRIGPIGISLCWSGSRVSDWPHKFYQEFLVDGKADVALRVHCQELPACSVDELLFEAQDNRWNLYRSNGHYVFETFDTSTGNKNRLARLDPDLTNGDVYVKPEWKTVPSQRLARRGRVPTWSLPLLMRQLGELLVVNLLSRDRGLLVHALGVNDQGRGLLVVGPSGSGKTTLANLYQRHTDATILGDERIVVSKARDEFLISGTPWSGGGMRVASDTVPLRRIFLLEHAKANTLFAEGHATLTGLLFQQLFLPFWDRRGMTFVLRFLQDLFQTIPAHRLGFVNDARVIEFIRESITAA